MSPPFALVLAWREGRSSWRRIGLYMGAIALGVAALVAINSFRANVVRSVRGEARALLGADVRMQGNAPFAPAVQALLDSLAAAGVPVSHETRLVSMVLAPRSGQTRLLQVRALEGGYPFYGAVRADPAAAWPLEAGERRALVDPAVLVQLDASPGDTLAIGEARFVIAGTLEGLGGDVGFQSAVGPRVFIPAGHLGETGLVRLGSLVRYYAYLRLPDDAAARRFEEANGPFLRESMVRLDTAEEEVEDLTEALGSMGRFLGLVGIMAMLLGGIGVASAVHVFIREKLPAVAVLRCLGASQRSVFLAYLLQTGVLGLGGAAAGAGAGLLVQAVLPRVLGGFLPVDVGFAIHWPSVLAGLLTGAWVAVAFALLPLLTIRDVAPLQALRRDIEPGPSRRDLWRALTWAALAASIALLSVWQAPTPRTGLVFAAGIVGIVALLWATALALVRATRRFFPRRAGFVVRQGVANLFRPRNQTVAVTLALGFGAFLVATIYLVQGNLLARFRLDGDAERPNLLFFDIQQDQREEVAALVASRGVALREPTPIVPGRIAALNGRPAAELLADSSRGAPEGWTLRREYRNTYRDTLVATEEIVAGAWWGTESRAGGRGAARDAGSGAGRASARALPRVSVEADLARDLGIGVGDRITWDVQGVEIETEVASLRRVDWARFAPNFFVVFEPGVLEAAPQSLIALARVPDATGRAELQRDLVQRLPNVSVLDLAQVQQAVDGISSKVTLAIRFLALFTIGGGIVVLVGSLATSRYQRMRESALLKTLGGSRGQVRSVLLVEYLALGALAGATGILLAGVAAWALVTRFFELEFRLPLLALLGVWAAVAALTVAVGFLNSRGVVRRTPLAMLREVSE